MNLLILGGTVFLGRHVAEAALASGHRLTLFNRGRTQPELFPEAHHIHGDRDGGIAPLLDETFDAVIDTCGFVPRVVAQSTRLRTRRYVFVSSVSVYADLGRVPDVGSPTLPAVDHEDVSAAYGALKAACEEVVRDAYGSAATVIRPGLIGGPHDPTHRFSYWPQRLAEGGRVLAPLPREAPVQVIDVRDLATWILLLAHEEGQGGTWNAVGQRSTMEGFLGEVQAGVGATSSLVWTDAAALGDVRPWTELPLWLPGPEHDGMLRIDPAPAVAAGLKLRPLRQTAADTLAWVRTLGGPPPRQADGRYLPGTLSREKEAAILEQAAGGPAQRD